MNTQFKKGALSLCVLTILSRRDCYGYELVQIISGNIEVAEGTIYPLLRRLSAEGYLEAYFIESAGGPPRKYYRLTENGQRYRDKLASEWKGFTEGVSRILEAPANENSKGEMKP
ncbi:MAG: PadR family transcriptional regulator [Acidobacteria bacterium]|nr:PadR family transcriptional regulator [Acidobacteriota bacterium]